MVKKTKAECIPDGHRRCDAWQHWGAGGKQEQKMFQKSFRKGCVVHVLAEMAWHIDQKLIQIIHSVKEIIF